MEFLFIGNSYTAVGDLPRLFAGRCADAGSPVCADSVTHSGFSLPHFLSGENPTSQEMHRMLAEKRYDVVVVQDQSVRPAKFPDAYLDSVRTLLPLLGDSTVCLYETWGRRDGHEVLLKNGWTHEEMEHLLHDAVRQAADAIGAIPVFAGEAITRAYRGNAGDTVFSADGSHLSPAGVAVVADCFFETVRAHGLLGKERAL